MSNTVFERGGSHTAHVEEGWGEKTYRQAEKDSFFNDGRFVGTDSNSLIQVNVDLTKHKGDMINTPLRARVISDGKVDDAAIEGQRSYDEEAPLEPEGQAQAPPQTLASRGVRRTGRRRPG